MATKIDQKTEILQRAKDCYAEAKNHESDWLDEAEESYDFVAGRQWTPDDLALLNEQNRPVVTFNRLTPLVDSVSGSEINNRQEVRYIPRKEGAVQVSEIITGASEWVRDECDAEFEESHAFMDVVICGMGWTETRLTTDEDPAGKIEIERVDPLEFRWDPGAKKRNLADARWIMRIKDVPVNDAETMFPEAELDDLNAVWAGEPDGGTPHDATEAPEYKNDQSGAAPRSKKTVRLVEYQWWEHENYYLVLDPFTNPPEKKQFGEEEYKKLTSRIEEVNKTQDAAFEVDSIRMRRKVYKRCFIGGEVLGDIEKSPGGNSFTYKCITGKFDRNEGIWYGIVRALKDPQRWANKWLSTTMHIMNSNAKGGLLAETDAFVNARKAEDEWSDPASITWLNSGGLAKIQQKEAFNFPMGFDKLMGFAIQSIPDVSGINLNFMALTTGEEAATLDRQRKQTALTILAGLFDNLRRYRREQGRLLLYYITTYISDGRLIRIVQNDLEQFVPLVHDPGIIEYDIIVDDNPTSPNMKEKTWGVLMQLMPMLSTMPIPPSVWMEVLKQSPLPSTFIEGVQKITSVPPQPDPVQQAYVQRLIAQSEKDMAAAAKDSAEIAAMPQQQMMANYQMLLDAVKQMTGEQQSEADLEQRQKEAALQHIQAMNPQAPPQQEGASNG